MAKLTDEMLMAYADGQLNALARAKVEAVLPGDQDARRRLGVFRATGAPLAQLYAGPMAEPVPAHLKDFVLNYRAPAAPAKKASLAKGRLAKALAGSLDKARRAGESFGAWLAQPMPQTVRWRLAAAQAAMLALGAGAGFFCMAARSGQPCRLRGGPHSRKRSASPCARDPAKRPGGADRRRQRRGGQHARHADLQEQG